MLPTRQPDATIRARTRTARPALRATIVLTRRHVIPVGDQPLAGDVEHHVAAALALEIFELGQRQTQKRRALANALDREERRRADGRRDELDRHRAGTGRRLVAPEGSAQARPSAHELWMSPVRIATFDIRSLARKSMTR